MTDPATILKTEHLRVGYQQGRSQNVLFEDLNLQLDTGKLVCFMGPNGAGKSTLLRTLTEIQAPLSGAVENLSDERIAIVLTDRVHAPAMKVHELVTYGRYPHLPWNLRMNAEDRKQIMTAMERVRITPLAGQLIAELSDGQMQMVMIARALAQDSTILLMDEPTAHLDLNNRVEMMNMLREIAREQNRAILVATHELDLALQTSDLIWLVTGRQTIKYGLPEDLVLDGSFDEVFQFKGFDLKTGKVKHRPFRQSTIKLKGEGPVYLWTKNALERTGYILGESEIEVSFVEQPKITWQVQRAERSYTAESVKQLLDQIEDLV